MTVERWVDAHLHAWDRSRFRYPWLEADDRWPTRFVPGDLPSSHRPATAVFIEADSASGLGAAEATWAARLPHGAFAAVVAHAPIDSPALGDALDELVSMPKVVGIRRLLQDEPRDRLADPVWAEGVRAVGDRGLSFDACVRDDQLPALAGVVAAASGTTVVLDHLGKPPVRSGWGSPRAQAWAGAIRRLAAEPNVVVKLSGLPAESGSGALPAQMRPYVEVALDAFGSQRALAGSDWPVSRRADWAYGDWFTFLADGFGLNRSEQQQVLRDTAMRVYRIPEIARTGGDDE